MKCWYSAFCAQRSRLIIVVVQLGAVKIYVAAVEAGPRKDSLTLTFSEFHPPLNANVLVCMFFFESHPVYDQTQGSGAVFLSLYR
jgi:hypothetical protein